MLLTKGKTFSRKFTEKGQYPYFCQLHPNMVGRYGGINIICVGSWDYTMDFYHFCRNALSTPTSDCIQGSISERSGADWVVRDRVRILLQCPEHHQIYRE